jgi:hypothetical protein
MANTLSIEDYPAVLTAMAFRPFPTTIARFVAQPQFLQDTRMRPGEVYQMDAYGFLPDLGDMDIESRTRSSTEILGTANNRIIPTRKIPILLREITGPGSGDANNPGLPGNFRFSVPDMIRSQRRLWDQGFAEPLIQPQFHSSVGSDTLLMDYRTTIDRFYIRALANTPNKWNPRGIIDGGTYASGPPKITVSDLDYILEWLVSNKCPPYDDGLYRVLITPRQWNHLRQDTRFREQLQAASYFPVSLAVSGQDNIFGSGYMPPPIPMANDNISGVNPDIYQKSLMQLGGNPINQPSLVGFMPYIGQSMPGLDNMAMPGGYIYNQFRFFVSNNIPNKQVSLNYTAVVADSGEATGLALRTAYPGMYFGKYSVGEIFGGDPISEIPVQICRNQNSDYNRFLIVVWQAFMGLARLNDDFVIESRTYGL